MRAALIPTLLVLLTACAPPPVSPEPDRDACGASGYQGLVGQSKSVLATMMLPAGSRVIGPNEAVTMDLRPDRLNVEIGSDGRINSVGCY